MRSREYDIRISGEELQSIDTVSAVNARHLDPAKYEASFEASRLKSKLGSLRPGELYLDPNEFSALDVAGGGLRATLTALDGDFSKTRKQSRTDVRFAQLVLEDDIRGQHAELVAVKYTRAPLAAREFAATCFMNASGLSGIRANASFTPLGFVNNPEKSTARNPVIGMITKYEHNVLTLDRVFWDRERQATPEEVQHAFGIAAVWLADLHANGFGHGDAQAKNVAHDNTTQPRYVDLETAVNFRSERGEIKPEQARAHITEDVETFLRRLDGDYTEQVEEQFARPYVERMAQSTLPSSVRLTEADIMGLAALGQQPVVRFNEYI